MRVGINAAVLSSPLTGVGYYTLRLLQALARGGEDFEWALMGASPSQTLVASSERVRHFPARKLTSMKRALWQQLVLPRLASRLGVDVLHCPDFSRPLRVGAPVVNTIHDLTFLDPQSPIPFVKRNYKKSLAQFAITHSARIIAVSEFTTLSKYSDLCFGYPCKDAPGAVMRTEARKIHRVAIADSPPILKKALDSSGLTFDQIDHVIPHQTSERSIRSGARRISEKFGVTPKNVIVNLHDFGNTASTTHFTALYRYLNEGLFKKGDNIMLVCFASGLVVGVVIFTMDDLVDKYGKDTQAPKKKVAEDGSEEES